MIVWLMVGVIALFVLVILCRLLARVIREGVNRWDR